MAREFQSRFNATDGMRPMRSHELEGTGIMPPMFRDEYIKTDGDGISTRPASTAADGNGNYRSNVGRQSADESQPITGVLPVEKSFPIQIGSELFRLSGASIMSDAPSYFSEFFVKQMNQNENGEIRTLYIDRDPATFQDICRHLQGYFVGPRDGVHYVRLFADAQFYNLPRLVNQLFESPIYIEVGGQNFQVPRDLFGAPGNQSNFFSLGFGALFAEPVQVFPGLERINLLRPPSIQPSIVTHRSAETFAEILFLLREYPLRIRDEEHRQALLNDARYYHLRNLEQKLIHHQLSYNVARRRSEITLRLEDIKQSGISFHPDEVPLTNENAHEPPPPIGGYVNYARPYLEEPPAELILEIGSNSTEIDLKDMRADFRGRTSTIKDRISSLFQVIANKMNLKTTMPLGLMMANGGATALPKSPGFTPLSEHRVKVSIGSDAAIVLDGEEFVMPSAAPYQDTSGVETPFSMPTGDFMHAMSNTPPPSSRQWANLPPDHASMLARSASAGHHSQQQQQQQMAQANTNQLQQQQQQQQQQLPYQQQLVSRKRKRRDLAETDEGPGTWIVSKGQWRLRIRPRVEQTTGGSIEPRFEVVLCAVKLEAARGERGRNLRRAFLV